MNSDYQKKVVASGIAPISFTDRDSLLKYLTGEIEYCPQIDAKVINEMASQQEIDEESNDMDLVSNFNEAELEEKSKRHIQILDELLALHSGENK